MNAKAGMGAGLLLIAAVALWSLTARTDEFTREDLQRWEQEFMVVVKQGEKLFHSGELGRNGVSCDQCHPNGANTHPETFPKFQKQLGRVVTLFEMINWCILNPLEGEPMEADDPRRLSLQAYIHYERKGVPLAPGRH